MTPATSTPSRPRQRPSVLVGQIEGEQDVADVEDAVDRTPDLHGLRDVEDVLQHDRDAEHDQCIADDERGDSITRQRGLHLRRHRRRRRPPSAETESADAGSAGTAVVLFGQGGQCTVVRGQFRIFVFVLVADCRNGHRVAPRRWSSRSRGCCHWLPGSHCISDDRVGRRRLPSTRTERLCPSLLRPGEIGLCRPSVRLNGTRGDDRVVRHIGGRVTRSRRRGWAPPAAIVGQLGVVLRVLDRLQLKEADPHVDEGRRRRPATGWCSPDSVRCRRPRGCGATATTPAAGRPAPPAPPAGARRSTRVGGICGTHFDGNTAPVHPQGRPRRRGRARPW